MEATMVKIRCGKWGSWIALVGLLFSLLAVVTAQPGFLSISCGGKENHTAKNGIEWVSDADYIDVGHTGDIGDVYANGSYLQTLRFFNKPLKKSCYKLPVTPDVPYLVRLWFAIGNYTGFPTLPSFQFSIETPGTLHVVNVTMSDRDPVHHHRILVSSGKVLYICFIRTSEHDDPFVSAIELRMFQHGMYAQAKPGTVLWPDYYNVGGNSVVRYPDDKFDRIWMSDDTILAADSENLVRPVSSQETISTSNTEDLPPTAVMQTAWVGNNWDIIGPIKIASTPEGTKSMLVFYFAEIETLQMHESRSFYVAVNGERPSDTFTLKPNHSAIEWIFLPSEIRYYFNVIKAPKSNRSSILNAFEYHWLYDTDQATYSQDIYALDAFRRSFDIQDWVSDPCYLIPWKGIGCDNSSSNIRISKIYLSGRNLTGLVPTEIAQLTSLVNVSLDNNHLMGSLPNFSNLTMLAGLYLQNNNLSGTVPEWLFQLQNLKELNLENNNFSGVIPAQLLLNCSLKFNYLGNPYLRMDLRERTPQISNNNKLKLVLGITLGGLLIIALALIVGISMYRKKSRRRNEQGVAAESSGVEMEPRHFLHQDYPMVVVPNPTKSRAFTLDEMVTATQNFSQEIGRGGFGSVFLGKLPEGKNIAVKVLSLFSHQGVQEFLNEVDLLSRINHRNLVSLLGYCNETRQVMLIYEHMPGGPLRDLLYGASAEHSELNWKTRLTIALNAAQGLEYLHVGSIPKIIHRDIKTSNILLDSNMNGKLADFGLSRMTIDGEATHVTTAVKGTAGYLDPEYYYTQTLTEKSDVYSFGVVLLELICGRPPIDLKLPENEINIIQSVTPYLMEMDENAGKITEIIDERLGGSYNMKSISGVAKVAMRCVQAVRSCRPSVSEVVAELLEAIKHEEIGIESAELLAGEVDSIKFKGMKWSDNSSNISNVGR